MAKTRKQYFKKIIKIKNPKKKALTKKKVFTKKHYNSGDGMLTTVWGPSMWHYLHTMSFNYPVNPTRKQKQEYKKFILSLRDVLPCVHCRKNLRNNLKAYPIKECHLKDRNAFSRYVYQLHETINRMLQKRSNLSYCDVRERYEHFRSRCTTTRPKIFKFKKTRRVREKGCTEPLYGQKAKCIIKIVPQSDKCKTLTVDKKCLKVKK